MDGNLKNNPYLQTGFAFGYLCKNTEAELNTIAAASGGEISGQQLAEWLGAYLLAKAHGASVGTSHNLSALRRQTASRNKGVESLAVAGNAHRRKTPVKRKMTKKARKLISLAQKARWKAWHEKKAA